MIDKRSLKSIGFDLKNAGQKIIIGIGIFAILEVVFAFAIFFIYGTKLEFVQETFFGTLFRTIYFIFFLGFAEELIFREYLLECIKEVLNSEMLAVIISSVIFALWHYPTSFYFGQVIFAFFFGIILSLIRVKLKGNIILSLVIAHGLYNSFIYWGRYFIK